MSETRPRRKASCFRAGAIGSSLLGASSDALKRRYAQSAESDRLPLGRIRRRQSETVAVAGFATDGAR